MRLEDLGDKQRYLLALHQLARLGLSLESARLMLVTTLQQQQRDRLRGLRDQEGALVFGIVTTVGLATTLMIQWYEERVFIWAVLAAFALAGAGLAVHACEVCRSRQHQLEQQIATSDSIAGTLREEVNEESERFKIVLEATQAYLDTVEPSGSPSRTESQ